MTVREGADILITVSKLLMLVGLTAQILLDAPGLAGVMGPVGTLCFILAIILMGRSHRKLPLILPIGFAVGFAFEAVGVATGLPFGSYRYVALGGARVLDVPVAVPVAWGVLSAVAYLAAKPFARGLKLVFLASALMVVLDLAIDPFMTAWQAWVWEGGWGPTWHRVPLSNFVGWFIVSFVIIGLYELALRGGGPSDVFFSAMYIYVLSIFAVLAPEDAGLLALSAGLTLFSLLLIASRRSSSSTSAPLAPTGHVHHITIGPAVGASVARTPTLSLSIAS